MFLVTRDVLYKQLGRVKWQGRPDAWTSSVNLGSGNQIPTCMEQAGRLVCLPQQLLAHSACGLSSNDALTQG